MSVGMLVQIGLCWLAVSALTGLFYAMLRNQRSKAYWRGHHDGYHLAVTDARRLDKNRLRVVK